MSILKLLDKYLLSMKKVEIEIRLSDIKSEEAIFLFFKIFDRNFGAFTMETSLIWFQIMTKGPRRLQVDHI